jgi:hypothetical protein
MHLKLGWQPLGVVRTTERRDAQLADFEIRNSFEKTPHLISDGLV